MSKEEQDKLTKAFTYGIDYGMFLAEANREKELLAEAGLNSLESRRTSMPVSKKEWLPKSEKWFEYHKKAKIEFLKLFINK